MIGDIIGEIVGGLLTALLEWVFRPVGRVLGWLFRPVGWLLRLLWRPFGWLFGRVERIFDVLDWLRSLAILTFVNVFWLFFIGLSLYFLQSSWRLARHGQPATGVVVALDERRDSDGVTYSPVVEFDTGGRTYRFDSGISSYPAAYDVGERVAILYDPANPNHAKIKAWWSAPPLYILLFALMVGAALLTNFLMMRRIWRGESMVDG